MKELAEEDTKDMSPCTFQFHLYSNLEYLFMEVEASLVTSPSAVSFLKCLPNRPLSLVAWIACVLESHLVQADS